MNQQNFVSHAPVSPPAAAPRPQGGLGIFGVLAIIIAVLAGVLTGAIFLVAQWYQTRVGDAVERLKKIKEESQLASLEEVRSIQERIDLARMMLEEHTYPTHALEFAEQQLLEQTRMHSFAYSDGAINMQLTVPSFLVFAEQLNHFRTLAGKVADVKFDSPTLTDRGDVTFDVSIKLEEGHLRTSPSRARDAAAQSETVGDTVGETLSEEESDL